MAVKIQGIGKIAHKDVLDRLNIDCESFRGELETQLSWVRDIQWQLVQGANQLSIDVDSKLIQYSQRSEQQGAMIKGLYTSMQELIGVGKNRQENILVRKIHIGRPKLAGINNAIDGGEIEVLTQPYKTSISGRMGN